jgi:lysophospholipase L1-like esterase
MRIGFFGDSLTAGLPGSSYVALLRERFPDDTLLNLGRGNDTVASLYQRIVGLRFDEALDLAFLWVGVNDLPAKTTRLYRAANTLAGQRRSRDLAEFRAFYEATLDHLCRIAERVTTVSPMLRGEDLDNRWNRQLGVLARTIEDLTSQHEQAEYLDLRAVFARELATRPISNYVPKGAVRVILDALTLRNREQIDRKAAQRGLHLTLDGLHLNSAGAEIVAEGFSNVIRDAASHPPDVE